MGFVGTAWNKGRPMTTSEKQNISRRARERFKKQSAWNKGLSKESQPMFGKKHSKITKDKMRKAATGRKLSDETKKKLSLFRTGPSPKTSLQKHWNWRGGKSFEPYSPKFNLRLKQKVRLLADFKCQSCNSKQSSLNQKLCIHHIDFNKDNCEISNLQALCRSCHSRLTNAKRKCFKGQ